MEMTPLTNIPSRIGGVVLFAAAVGTTAGLAPASAAPAPSGAALTVEQVPNSERWLVQVQGTFPMGEYEAHGFVNNINSGKALGGTLLQLYGDSNGDLRHERFYPGAGREPKGYLFAAAEGVRYRRVITLPKNILNEGNFHVDYIYARVKFIDANGDVRGDQYSAVVDEIF
jgi:hypothetical protein